MQVFLIVLVGTFSHCHIAFCDNLKSDPQPIYVQR